MTTTGSLLIIGIGNPSRGDDAIGPVAIERLGALGLPDTELLTDFQLQVEYALDLVGRREVVFIDAAASGPAPFSFQPAAPVADASATSHALSPAAVLDACGFGLVFIETVGTGQSEVEVAGETETTLVVLAPGAGDDIQGIKRGIMEMADLIVINKADGDNIKKAELAKR